uniref:Uncharacterized protein n=1 Tax=Alexandrium catenella TaxID=2925 RepID=A0A6T9JJ04_ALECA
MARTLVCVSLLLGSASAGLTTDMMKSGKSMMCSMAKIPLICSDSSSSSRSAASCGSECCQASSCYSIPTSMFKCKSDRGPTECFGAGTFPPSAGVCRCKYGDCSIAGICPSGPSRLYETTEEEQEVTPEDFTMAFAGFGLFACCALFLSGVVFTRVRRRWLPARAVTESLVLASDDEAQNTMIE